MAETHDPLRLGVKKARGCTQRFRQLARGEVSFKDIDALLRSSTGCHGRGCEQCAEAALRLIDLTAWAAGPTRALEIATWVARYVSHIHVDFRLRAETVIAALLRFTDTEMATRKLAATDLFREECSPAERAHHLAHAATVLTDAYRIGEAREAVIQSRELYQQGCPTDPERGPAWAAIADTFVETGAPYVGLEPHFASIDRALQALVGLDKQRAPRTYQALTVNILAVVVSGWRSGFKGIDPHAILDQLEKCFDFQSCFLPGRPAAKVQTISA